LTNAGRISIGNSLPNGFVPRDRVHLHQTGVAHSAGFTAIRFTNDNTGTTATDGSHLGMLGSGTFYLRQFEALPIIFESPDVRNAGTMTNWMHISNGLTGFGGYSTDGYVGLNEDSAMFHLDIKTPFKNLTSPSFGGELFLSCRTSDVPYSRMGMLNIAGGNGIFSATLFGNMDSTQTGSGLNTLAVIHPKQDSSFNLTPVQRFIVGTDWEYNTNAVDAISELENRNAFSWQNVGNVKMLMNAKGRVRIGNSINLSDTIKNRLVITSSTIDPGLGVSTTVGGSSGLQFTNLIATTPPLATNPGTGILSVDSAGNVIYVDASNFGKLGNLCDSTSNPLIANYEIPLNNHNFIFSDDFGTGQILMGDVSCSNTTDARVYIRNNSNSSGLQKGIFVESLDANGIGGDFGGNLYGIRAAAPVSAGYAGWFNGDVYINSPTGLSGVGVVTVSDQQFKTNINTIANATSIIQQLGVKFHKVVP